MGTSKSRGTFIQCQNCGHIYTTEDRIPIDEMYVASICPRCDWERGLNCGSDENDICLYRDINVDPRYYEY